MQSQTHEKEMRREAGLSLENIKLILAAHEKAIISLAKEIQELRKK